MSKVFLSYSRKDKDFVNELYRWLARDGDDKFEAEIVCKAVVKEMARVADESDTLSYEHLEKVLPHAELLISSDAIKTEQAIDLANYLCMYYWRRERFSVAEKHGRKAVEISERHFKPGHPRIATSRSNLGEVLRNLGELKEARDLFCKALESDERSFEPGHPRIAISQANLGEVLKNIGELKEARDLLRKALKSDEKSFEPGHPIVALRQSILALVLQDLGELEAARDLAGRAYRSLLIKFGAEHSYTKTAKRNWETF
ncbi:MAG: tetratricopeptide repeat protein [Planctomycetota bacterium]|jgi:tetratricopeptide (TPR) repeat protein